MYLNSNDENLFKRQILENKISYLFNHANNNTQINHPPITTQKKCKDLNEIWSKFIIMIKIKTKKKINN